VSAGYQSDTFKEADDVVSVVLVVLAVIPRVIVCKL
jgi:hypothetical protein